MHEDEALAEGPFARADEFADVHVENLEEEDAEPEVRVEELPDELLPQPEFEVKDHGKVVVISNAEDKTEAEMEQQHQYTNYMDANMDLDESVDNPLQEE